MGKASLETVNSDLKTLSSDLKSLSSDLRSFKQAVETRFDNLDGQFRLVHVKLAEHDDLLHLIADSVSRHDDDLTYLKRTLRHQRV